VTTQLLVYEEAVPVTKARHADWSVEVGVDYSFSRRVNSVPLMAVEFPNAAAEYVIVFGGTGDVVMPAAILGLRAEENLFVSTEGAWQGKYVPAFLRRYPFVFSSRDEGKNFTLCIDEKFPGFNEGGKGERLFGEDGEPSDYTQNVLKFLQQYQLEFNRTKALCEKLKSLNLLEPMQAQINLESGEQRSLTGFSAVNRGRLKTLSAEALADLARSDELELIYNHLSSMRNFEAMRERVSGERSAAQKEAVEEERDPSEGNGSDAAAEKASKKGAARKTKH
jgi:hypothetical protein